MADMYQYGVSPSLRPSPGTWGLEVDDEDESVLFDHKEVSATSPVPQESQSKQIDVVWGESEVGGGEESDRPQWKVEIFDRTLEYIMNEAVFTFSLVRQEVEWFFFKLGLDDFYFKTTDFRSIAQHIQSIYAAKILAAVSGSPFDIKLRQESDQGAFYCTRSMHQFAIKVERRIEQLYLEEGYTSSVQAVNKGIQALQSFPAMRMSSYRTKGSIGAKSNRHLRVYFLSPARYEHTVGPNDPVDINKLGNTDFLRTATENTKRIYQEVLTTASKQLAPAVRMEDVSGSEEEVRIVIAYKRGGTHSFLSGVSDLLRSFNLHSTRKYIEQFQQGYVVMSMYVRRLEESSAPINKEHLTECIYLAYALPRTSLSPLFQEGLLSMQQMSYAYCAWKFSYLFAQSRSAEMRSLVSTVRKAAPDLLPNIITLRQRLQAEAQSGARIRQLIMDHVDLIKMLYADFEKHLDYKQPGGPAQFDKTHGQDILNQIKRQAKTEFDQNILETFLIFNRHCMKTNFFRKNKVCLSFRLDPSFLGELDYSIIPFGMFFVVGSEFRGFHLRFADVARGGIRIIRSPNQQAFINNSISVFTENYNLAYTQQKKNKDIPEGGSKGTILLDMEHQSKAEVAFKKYVDGILSLILPSNEVVDHYGKPEILFFGPDEGTADVMDWAASYARSQGAPFWKGFTTGKSVTLGGIPHDLYGMTTRGVHQYVLGIIEKKGIREEDLVKFQTGGPDGDLGSNEVKISKDKTIGVVDGSGVLYDPLGLERGELTRLANLRLPCVNFDRKYLSPQGFLVKVEDTDLTLPDGTVVDRGMNFRNEFHLSKFAKGDLFVPCGGRPNAVNGDNVDTLFENGVPKFKYIVEGANLFFTQEARLALEKAGVLLFKDSSANKGGVTSSSMEVLGSLSLSDEEYDKHLCVKNNMIPDFRKQYVNEVIEKIEKNARKEFETLWREHQATGTPYAILSDDLSIKINNITDGIARSSLWRNEVLRRDVLSKAIPQTLIALKGLDAVLARVPENYVRAIFNTYIASSYIYSCGLSAAEFEFFEFVNTTFRTQA
eukprot:TRINITY_DN2913_c0_g1::TRINITY_DN2913_c0_g1_i1::g.4399::m.4399 TRINITY_DN2913_c0_g1::TRINITY_DN2913_c0_g1_i1::g.4399  ORF type:complete len:1081 (-),score=465.50,sp/Q54VI3/GLUD2_DICDI/47.79/0.0,ELFV_dehydrog/PF00208.16/8.8e-50,Bac_GDH/PF05088.7/4.8e-15,Bac_GDH/PF05088.7/9.5e-05,ELFV_dehydrog_N/PF02812.13/0.032,DUF2330/PF10092.4/0.1,DUF976/PF06162.7/0.3,DUF976/PF06162.7/1.1e+04 TRINITY_DN2913_c0_g1_i1:330-3488(-)